MPLTRQSPCKAVFPFGLFGLLALLLVLAWPGRAEAGVSCQVNSASLFFGSSLLGEAEVNYSCHSDQNDPPAGSTFTICTSIGPNTNAQYGTLDQPQLVGPTDADRLAFNLYSDGGRTVPFTQDNPVTAILTLGPGQTATGSLRFYGSITPGQSASAGNYSGTINNIIFGAIGSDGMCEQSGVGFNGQTYNLSVQAIVADACNLGLIQAIDFGTPTDFSGPIDATGSVQVMCPANREWTLHFDGGNQPNGVERRMISLDPGDGANYLAYRLYSESGRTSGEIPIDGTISGIGNGTIQTSPVYGRVAVSHRPPEGEYSDIVIVTLSFF